MKYKLFRPIFKLAVSIGVLFLLFRAFGKEEILDALVHSNPWLLFGATLIYFLSQWVSTVRLQLLLKAAAIPISLKDNFILYLIGMTYNFILPGGIGGDAYKILVFKRKFGTQPQIAFHALLVERLLGLLALLLILSISLQFMPPIYPLQRYSLIAGMLLLPLSYVGMLIFFKPFVKLFFASLGYSLIIQMLQFGAIYLLSIFLNIASPVALSFVFFCSSLATAIPVFMGGLGARELVFGMFAKQVGLPNFTMVGLALQFSIITLISALPGLYFIWSRSDLTNNESQT